jgi:hypothetical protein
VRGFVKEGDTAAEVAGLRWLAVPGGPPLPDVLGEDPLVTRMIPPDDPRAPRPRSSADGSR